MCTAADQVDERGGVVGSPENITVEPLGAETLLVLSFEGSGDEVIARVGRDTALKNGDRASVALDPAAVYLFDPTTTKAITRAG